MIEQPQWLYRISFGLSEYRRIRILINGKRFAVVQIPGGRWGDNSGTYYGSTTYYLVDKQNTKVRDSVGLIECQELQQGGRAKLVQWKKLVEEKDAADENRTTIV
jgi:hypothetical protein